MIEASTNNPKPMTYIEENTLQWQEGTYPVWSDTKNGEVFEYSKDAIVRYSDGVAYISLVDNNVTEPTKDSSWVRFDSLFGTDVVTETKTISQISAKADDVTLHELKGVIQMFGSSLSAYGIVRFKLINSTVGPTDIVVVGIDGTSVGAQDGYEVRAVSNNGYATVIIKSAVGYVQSDTVKINFRVIKVEGAK